MQPSYSIHVYKQYLNFSAAHFITFPDGTREPLHGHNYRLEFKAHMPDLENDMVFDFLHIKPLARKLCDSLDHKLLLPSQNVDLKIDASSSLHNYNIHIGEDFFSLPKRDVMLLPLPNTSVERLAIYLAHELQEAVMKQFNFRFTSLEVEVEETPGQSAVYLLTNN